MYESGTISSKNPGKRPGKKSGKDSGKEAKQDKNVKDNGTSLLQLRDLFVHENIKFI
jgi:hypothetical protein